MEGSGNGEIKTACIWDFFQTEDVYHFEFPLVGKLWDG